jgi:hypothetical protein
VFIRDLVYFSMVNFYINKSYAFGSWGVGVRKKSIKSRKPEKK